MSVFKKFPAGGQVVEEIADFNRGALGNPDLLDRRDGASVDLDLGPGQLSSETRLHHEVGDRGDARQRFAPEAERDDRCQIFRALNLTGRMTLERQPRVFRPHAFAVILDAHQPLAAQFDVHLDASRPGVDGVFDELFGDRRGTLDDLARGDLIRQISGKNGDACHRDGGLAIRDWICLIPNPSSLIPSLFQSPTFTDNAACAAASRATGTRYGDIET